MRKLASIQKILSIEPIEGADLIDKARILGWQCVVKKNEFKVGDLAIYCEIDSLMPDVKEFEFLKSNGVIKRIRTKKLKGQVSQGICFPISILKSFTDKDLSEFKEDDDVTEIIGIKKYEPKLAACLYGKCKGNFPGFLFKSDETRVQVLKKKIDEYAGKIFYKTEKIDGSSQTIYINRDEFGVCSRNLDLLNEYEDVNYEEIKNAYWHVTKKFDIIGKLKKLNRNISLQGELIGPGIQGNKYELNEYDIRFFNAFDIDKQEYLLYEDFINLVNDLELKTVPILGKCELINDIDELVNSSIIKSTLNNKIWAEGIVYVYDSYTTDCNNRISFKAINPKFLLKYDE